MVTGATGFTGIHFLNYMSTNYPEFDCYGLSRRSGNSQGYQIVECDLFDREKLTNVLVEIRPSYVVHLAGATAPKSAAELWSANVGFTVGLIDSVSRAHINPRILVVGSAAEYCPAGNSRVQEGDPVRGEGNYGLTKSIQTRCAIDLAIEHELPLVIARTFNLIGPGLSTKFVGGALCAEATAANADRPMRVGRTDSVRDFIDVRDAVTAYAKLVLNHELSGIYNVSTGVGTSIEELLQLIIRLADIDESLVVREPQARDSDIDRMVGDNSKMVKALQWAPEISLENTVADMLDEYA